MAKKSKTKIEYSKREVIADSLLTSLEKGDKVAVVCSKSDLTLLIQGMLVLAELGDLDRSTSDKSLQFHDDLKTLRNRAFG